MFSLVSLFWCCSVLCPFFSGSCCVSCLFYSLLRFCFSFYFFFDVFGFFFFFKQNTAYEMRISDWSSDVCSSDLTGHPWTACGCSPIQHRTDVTGPALRKAGFPVIFAPEPFRSVPLDQGQELGMRLSQYFMPTLKETPKEAEIVSHRLMLRAGMVRQASAGIYSWLPLGFRVLKKIEQIVREEQDAAGYQEGLMPTIQSAENGRAA